MFGGFPIKIFRSGDGQLRASRRGFVIGGYWSGERSRGVPEARPGNFTMIPVQVTIAKLS